MMDIVSLFDDLLFLLVMGFFSVFRRGGDMLFVANSTFSKSMVAGFSALVGMIASHAVYFALIFVIMNFLFYQNLGQALVSFLGAIFLFNVATTIMTRKHISIRLEKDENLETGFLPGMMIGFKTFQTPFVFLALLILFAKNEGAYLLQSLFLEIGVISGFVVVVFLSSRMHQELLNEERAKIADMVVGGIFMLFALVLFYHFATTLYNVYSLYTNTMVKGLPM